MLNLCGIVVAILKMATARHFSMSGIYSGHHTLPKYEMSLKSDNVEFVWYCGGHFENGDCQKFSNVRNNLGHHYLPTYTILMISDNVEFSSNGDLSRVPIKCKTKQKRNEINENETKRNEINKNETKRNETKPTKAKRNQLKQNEID